jgi:hypothetical protein
MEIWNLFGQKVGAVAAARQIPVAHLPNGSYVLRWKDDQGAYRLCAGNLNSSARLHRSPLRVDGAVSGGVEY